MYRLISIHPALAQMEGPLHGRLSQRWQDRVESYIVWRILHRETLRCRAHGPFTSSLPDNLRPRSRRRRTGQVDEASTLATILEIGHNDLAAVEQGLHVDSD